MAELLGVVGAGISIAAAAGQLIDSIVRLDTFCSQIQNIPEDIQTAVDDMSTMVEIIEFVQTEIGHETIPSNCSSSMKVLSNLQQSAQQVGEVLEEMRIKLGKKKYWGRINAVRLIKKLEKAAKRVENAQRMVLILLVAENRMIFRQSFSAQITELTTISTYISSLSRASRFDGTIPRGTHAIHDVESSTGAEDLDSVERAHHLPIQRTFQVKDRNTSNMKLRIPLFFLNTAWEISAYKANQGWNFSLRSYNIRPYGAPIFEAIRNGDIFQVHELLHSGRASIWDRTSTNLGVLHFAARSCHEHGPTVLEYLVKSGADIYSVDIYGETPHYQLFDSGYDFRDEQTDLRLLSGYKVFTSHRDWIPSRPRIWVPFDNKNSQVSSDMIDAFPIFKDPPEELIRTVLREMWPPWKNTPPADRIKTLFPDFRTAGSAYIGRKLVSPMCVRECLSREDIQQNFANLDADTKLNLIWHTLRSLARHLILGLEKGIEEARLFLKDTYMAKGFLDTLPHVDPLVLFVTTYTMENLRRLDPKRRRVEQYLNYAQEGLNHYVSELMVLGIDIATLVDIESNQQSRDEGKYISRGYEPGHGFDRIVINYGLQADDWYLWLSHPRDDWAREFWDMIDHPERAIPGAWEED